MNEVKIKKDTIQGALISQSGSIYDEDDIQRFLLQPDLKKHMGERFICWMINFQILPPLRYKWTDSIISLISQYEKMCSDYLGENFSNPLNCIDASSAFIIKSDTERTMPLLQKLASQLDIKINQLSDVLILSQRIFVILSKSSPQLSYTQGYDRFILISFLICFSFTHHAGLPTIIGESLTYFLLQSIILFNPTARELEDSTLIHERFSKLDLLVEKEEPSISSLLKKEGHSSLHYALKWHLTLFVDIHTAPEIMYIWDQIIAHLSESDEYIRYLCVGHLRQVSLPEFADEMAMGIQRTTNWDVLKIVEDANQLMEINHMNCFSKFFHKFCACHKNTIKLQEI